MSDIRADLSQYYAVKALFEDVLGKDSFMRVKDYAPLTVWKAESIKLLKAIALSIEATVQVVDDDWKQQTRSLLLERGTSRVKSSKSIDDLFASLVATLGELAFLQIGFVPKGHRRLDRVPLIPQNWKLDLVRTVQYVQSPAQRLAQTRVSKPTE